MITVLDSNVHIYRTLGNNDDQSNVLKEVFSDHEFVKNYNIVSINSINWARIVAQSTYYVWAYLQIFNTALSIGRAVDFSIPSGAFGNGAGGLLAKRMGLPIGRILCATNANGRGVCEGEWVNGCILVKVYANNYMCFMCKCESAYVCLWL